MCLFCTFPHFGYFFQIGISLIIRPVLKPERHSRHRCGNKIGTDRRAAEEKLEDLFRIFDLPFLRNRMKEQFRSFFICKSNFDLPSVCR